MAASGTTLLTETAAERARGLLAAAAPRSSASAALDHYLMGEAHRAAAALHAAAPPPLAHPLGLTLPPTLRPLAPLAQNCYDLPSRTLEPWKAPQVDHQQMPQLQQPPPPTLPSSDDQVTPLFAQLMRYDELLAECAEECFGETDRPCGVEENAAVLTDGEGATGAAVASEGDAAGGSSRSGRDGAGPPPADALRRKMAAMRARLPR